MTPIWRRILIAGGFIIGIAIVALLAIVAYALLGEDDGEPGPQVAQRTQTATPAATPIPTPQAPTPTPAPEPTPEPTEEPPLPAALEEQQPPAQEQPPPPAYEPPAPDPTPPAPAEEPPPPPTEPPPPTHEPPSPPQSTYADDCQAWLDAGAPAEDPEGMAACTLLASEVCTAWLSDPSVPGGSDACALLEMLTAYSEPSYPPSTTLNCRYLEGTIIVGQDGQYLGVITCSKYDVDGIFNKYGSYGSKYSSTSIWNKYGSYGGKYSSDSPFNKYSSSPPQIMEASGFVAYLSVNSYVGGTVVDPLDLVLCCFGDRHSDLEYWLDLIP